MKDDDKKPTISKEEKLQDEIKGLLSLYEELKTNRSSWLIAWRELASMFDSAGYRDDESYSESDVARNIINKNIVDTTGVNAANTLASGMQGGMTSPARPWFTLRHQGFEEVTYDTDKFLGEVEERMRVIFANSNFYNVMFQVYEQLGIFGTACIFEEADLNGFRFTCIPVGTYVFDIDYNGRVDTCIRKIYLSYKQIEQQFGYDVLPDEAKRRKKEKKFFTTEKHAIYHAVFPNLKKSSKVTVDKSKKAYKSVYFMEAKKLGKYVVLRNSGYDSMPFFGVRWRVQAGDIYGKSPALDVLGDCKLLQKIVEDTAEGIHKQVDPPVLVPSSLQGVGVDLSAGGVNFADMGSLGQNGASVSAIQANINVQSAVQYQEVLKNSIRVGMYNDLFRMLMDSTRNQITALEVAKKEEEKLLLVGPVLERLQNELFIPLIERTIFLMEKYSALPEIPLSMQGQKIKIEFVSTLAQAQKIVSTGNIQQLLGFASQLAQLKPDVLDKIDGDRTLELYSEYIGSDNTILLPDDKVNVIRAQRAKAQQQMAAQQQMQTMMQGVKDIASLPMQQEGTPSALDAVLGGLGSI